MLFLISLISNLFSANSRAVTLTAQSKDEIAGVTCMFTYCSSSLEVLSVSKQPLRGAEILSPSNWKHNMNTHVPPSHNMNGSHNKFSPLVVKSKVSYLCTTSAYLPSISFAEYYKFPSGIWPTFDYNLSLPLTHSLHKISVMCNILYALKPKHSKLAHKVTTRYPYYVKVDIKSHLPNVDKLTNKYKIFLKFM